MEGETPNIECAKEIAERWRRVDMVQTGCPALASPRDREREVISCFLFVSIMKRPQAQRQRAEFDASGKRGLLY